MTEKHKEVEKMIAKVMKKKDLSRNAAIDYMLGVATGRLSALWRYDDSLPVGKQSKGILQSVGRKKRAPKSKRISILPGADADKPAKASKADKPAKANAKRKKRKPKPKPESDDQMIIEGAAE